MPTYFCPACTSAAGLSRSAKVGTQAGTHTHLCMYTNFHTHTCARMFSHRQARAHTHTQTNTHTRTHTTHKRVTIAHGSMAAMQAAGALAEGLSWPCCPRAALTSIQHRQPRFCSCAFTSLSRLTQQLRFRGHVCTTQCTHKSTSRGTQQGLHASTTRQAHAEA